MTALEGHLRALMQGESQWLRQLTQHCLQAPGKQVRPQLVFLSAGMWGGITDQAHRGAALVSLLHQASLLHDDVVDQASQRRGRPTLNAAWSNPVAVLLGDYLLAKALQLTTQHQDYALLSFMAAAAQAMSEGELLQLEQAQQLESTEEAYLAIIHKKTAHLFGTCLAMGAMVAGAPEAQLTHMQQAGEQLGLAFQLRDDWLDYGTTDVGKPLGKDLQEGKWTLPLIHALQHASVQEQQSLRHTLEHHGHDPAAQERVKQFVRQSPGMEYTQQRTLHYQTQALQHLTSVPDSPYKEALVTLIRTTLAYG
ncbi:MAG: polyprenyl synthetase family protein [Roseivirga sp.]